MSERRKTNKPEPTKTLEPEFLHDALKSAGAGAGKSFRFIWRYALIVFFVALALRGFYLFEASQQPDFNVFYMDEEYNLEWARSLASGVWEPPYDQLRDEPYFRAPLYSLFLAGLLALFGGNTLLARIAQIVIGSISCALAYGVAAKCRGQRVGVVAGLLCALYWVLAYFDGQFLQPVLLIFLLVLGLLVLFTAVERRSPKLAALGGLAFGLYSVTRPEIVVFFPFTVWWAWKFARNLPKKAGRSFVVLLLVGLLIPPAIATLRNGLVAQDWVVIASQGGVNFYIGNNPRSNGMQAVVPDTRATWWGGYEDTRAMAEEAEGRKLKPSEVSDYWFGRGFAFIKEEPGQWLRLTLRKAALLFGNVEIPNNEPYGAHRKNYLSLRSVPLGFAVLFGLFAASLPFLLPRGSRRPRKAPEALRQGFINLILQLLLVYALVIIAFFVTGRFRVPLVPLLAVGAAVALVTCFDFVRSRRLVHAVALLAVACAVAGVLSVDYFSVRKATSGFAGYTDALDALESGDTDAAIVKLEAVRRGQSVRAPELYVALARAYAKRGRPGDKAAVLEVAEEGLGHFPDEAELLWYAALGNLVARDTEAAKKHVERYIALKPGDVRALRLAFSVAMAQGRTADARALLSRAEEIDSESPLIELMRKELTLGAP